MRLSRLAVLPLASCGRVSFSFSPPCARVIRLLAESAGNRPQNQQRRACFQAFPSKDQRRAWVVRRLHTRMRISHLTVGFALLLTGCGERQIATGSPDYIPVHQCQANLKQIDGAKASWAQEHHKTTNDIPVWSDLVGRERYLISQPECSKGGTYSLGRVGEHTRCTVAGHTL